MNGLLSAASAAGPLAAGWPLHAWRLRRRLDTARRDPLSGLLTRAPFEEQARQMTERGGVSMVFLDLDGFKQLNDTYGHAAGDAAIRATGARLDAWMQVNGPGVAARLGGDEFAAALSIGSADELVWAAGDLYDALCQPVPHEGEDLPIEASVGAVWCPRGVAGFLPVLMRRADEAMYTAKRNGGGAFVTDALTPVQSTVNGRRTGRRGTTKGGRS